jgi:hypothetical protein
MEGKLCLTLIAKATFGLVPDGMARLVAPSPLVEDDLFHPGDRARILSHASDLAPYRPRVDVLFQGHAHSPDRVETPALAVRLSVYGEDASLDKTLHVHGDRANIAAAPRRFVDMPISWERAVADPDQNPAGVWPGGARMPNIVDPTDPARPAGFGPLAPTWGVRSRHLQGGTPVRRGSSLTVPSGLDWSFYQAAPIDQQIPALSGDEEIVLDNLLVSTPRLRTRLPSARGVARLYGADAPPSGFPLELEADTLMIDGDRQVCSIVWRGCLSIVGQEEDLSQLRAVIGVELPGYPMPWEAEIVSARAPAARTATSGSARDAEAAASVASSRGGSTVAFSPEEAQRLIAQAGARAPRLPDFGPTPVATSRSTRRPPSSEPLAMPPLESPDLGEETTAVATIPSATGESTRALSPAEAALLLQNAPRPASLPDLSGGSRPWGPAPPPPSNLGDEDSTTALMSRGETAAAPPTPSEPPDSSPSATLALSAEEAGILLDKPVMPFQQPTPEPHPAVHDEPLKRSETLVIEIEAAPSPRGRE